MAVKLLNRVMVGVASAPGTGVIDLGAAIPGYQTFAAAGAADGNTVHYVVQDGNDWEIGLGTYGATGPTLTRTSMLASSTGATLTLSGAAVVMDSVTAETLAELLVDAQSLAPMLSVTASRDAVASDRGKMLFLNHASTPMTYSIVAGVFPGGTYLNFINWNAALGTVASGAGVTFHRAGFGLVTSVTASERYSAISAYTYDGAVWWVGGDVQ